MTQSTVKATGVQQSANEARGSELRHIRLLVVDDDPQALPLVEMALMDAHFERDIEVASTVTAGLERIKADSHDLYLIDHRLPDGNGIDLISQAKKAGITKPFILMTGYGSGALDEAALHEGAADYVEKHMLSAHLERAIRYAVRDWNASRILRDREDQLRHAQKMEGIGRLAGGVAHDFNNLLTAIVGFTDLILERIEPNARTADDVREIRKAADRATALTRQLLAFSRKQFLNPTVLDVNETVSGLIQMLPRVIGEHIETTTKLAPQLPRVWADSSQMDQVLVNLVLNARDAMQGGGQLTIETASVELNEDRLNSERLTLKPGLYVMLAVNDTGTGMDEETRARAFEPFFTTKPKGQGTGLGLATVYGIIDQSGGGIALDTATGRGTSVRIYLPVTSATEGRSPRGETPTMAVRGGTETLLLVEDNDSVRQVTAESLRRRGYTVYEARNAEEALEWFLASNIKFDLLVTDVVMPGLSGPNLAARLVRQNPQLKVLYISGYTEDATAVQGNFWGGVPLLQKPFTPTQLADGVRMALKSAPARS